MIWDDWSYAMFWRSTLLVLVWVFLVSTTITSIGHLVTARITAHQEHLTPLGPALVRRELALGVKAGLRVGFYLLLTLSATWGIDFDQSPVVLVIALPLIVASLAVIWHMGRYIVVLRRERWGSPVAVTMFSEETAATIDTTAEDVGEVKERVRRIETRLNGRDRP